MMKPSRQKRHFAKLSGYNSLFVDYKSLNEDAQMEIEVIHAEILILSLETEQRSVGEETFKVSVCICGHH